MRARTGVMPLRRPTFGGLWIGQGGGWGGALFLSGRHQLQCVGRPEFGTMSEISLSAWTFPTDLGVYKEIFRKEDGDRRVLFSFQHDGTILSLGLNINGYVECDASIDPARS